MKKILLIALLSLSTLIQAEDFGGFVGLQAGYAKIQIEELDSPKGPSYGLRLGFIKETGRVYLSVDNASLDKANQLNIAFNFDAITPRPYRFNDSFALRAFVGAHIGGTFITPNEFQKDEAIMGGGQAGILFDFPSDISIELGVKGTWTDAEYGSQKIDNYQNIYLAYDYSF